MDLAVAKMTKLLNLKSIILFLFFFIIAASFIFDLNNAVSFEMIKKKRQDLQNLVDANYILYFVIFFIIYVVVTALALPIAVFKTLLAGAIFGFWNGIILVSFASSIGACLCFLLARYTMRDYVQNKMEKYIDKINQGIKEDGLFYLFFLRLNPVFPFFVINFVFGLTNFKVRDFFLISQIGMIPATAIFVNAGMQIASINDISEILTLKLIVSLSLIGIFPLIVKKIYQYFKK